MVPPSAGLLPERQGQNLALTVLYVPYSEGDRGEGGERGHPVGRGASGGRRGLGGTASERKWHTCDSQGQILALIFRLKFVGCSLFARKRDRALPLCLSIPWVERQPGGCRGVRR